ncbi:IS6 family transposase [Siccirubricoccus deserti]
MPPSSESAGQAVRLPARQSTPQPDCRAKPESSCLTAAPRQSSTRRDLSLILIVARLASRLSRYSLPALGRPFSGMVRDHRLRKLKADVAFKGRHFTAEVILWAVHWYLMFPISYRDLELMLQDRGVSVDHTAVFRWIQAYALDLEKRARPSLRLSNGSWRVDETYIRVKGRWTYLYRAVDSRGQTIDFLLAAKRDAAAAKRFFRKALQQPHGEPAHHHGRQEPGLSARDRWDESRRRWRRSRLRQVKYLNNIVEQDHRRVKRLVRPGLGFGGFHTARRTLAGYEVMAMMRKGQVRKVGARDMAAQARFAELFPIAA